MQKNSILKKLSLLLSIIFVQSITAQQSAKVNPDLAKTIAPEKKYTYETAPNDPLKARIYKLENGLTVYMTVYKDAPRIQTYIVTKAGSKNDPSDATGLAHYLEHMLFKGTDQYGSKDFSKEKPYIDQIENLYEVYRSTKEEGKRKTIYHQIDSVSGLAAKYAIANEYDKMLSAIGAQGTNAFTSFDQTVYVNDIPSNQLDKWLKIESERFRHPVMRLFHTELEAVYEEKNRGLDNDGSKIWEALFAGLFQKNTYGTQTTIGTIEHLKNPSIKKIEEYYNTYYVPNNMAICLSGDFNPDSTIKKIDQTLGKWQAKPVPNYNPGKETEINSPIIKEVVGPDAETMVIGYRFEGAGSKDADMIFLINNILSNGSAGLIDLNLNQKQKVLSAGSYGEVLKDYSIHLLSADPKEGQKLEELKELLIAQLELVKKGEFPDWMLTAIVNNLKLQEIKGNEENKNRAMEFVTAFTNNESWQYHIDQINRLSKITKKDVMEFAKTRYNNNYVVVYKRTGEDKKVEKVIKPAITPVDVNREEQSTFVKGIVNAQEQKIEPVFLDYVNDIKTLSLKNNIPVLYKENKENGLFDLYYVIEMGSNNDKKLPVAIEYLNFLGTSKYKPEQIQQEFYKLGSSFGVFSSEDQIYVSLNGLNENFGKALQLFEELLNDAQPNADALNSLVDDITKKRADAKLNKGTILFQAMRNYGVYGPKSPFTTMISEEALKAIKPEELTSIIKNITSYEHHILYYGPMQNDNLTQSLNTLHKVPAQLKPVPAEIKFEQLETKNAVYVVDYDMKQAEILMLSKSNLYNKDSEPIINVFNSYFGTGMSSVVFQELRESKALAYTAYANYSKSRKKDKACYIFSYIGAQADKLPEATAGMMGLLNNMPESPTLFTSAKDAVLQNLRTERITKADILFNYEQAKKLGLNYDIRKDVYNKVPSITLADVKAFQEQYIKNKNYVMLVMGKKENLDIKTLEKYGQVNFLTLKDIFGY